MADATVSRYALIFQVPDGISTVTVACDGRLLGFHRAGPSTPLDENLLSSLVEATICGKAMGRQEVPDAGLAFLASRGRLREAILEPESGRACLRTSVTSVSGPYNKLCHFRVAQLVEDPVETGALALASMAAD